MVDTVIAEWFERLTANAEVATDQGSTPHPGILRHNGIWGAADETVLNKVLEKPKKSSLIITIFSEAKIFPFYLDHDLVLHFNSM